MNNSLQSRIYDRANDSWFTPSQRHVWQLLQRFDGPPYRVVNVYGTEGTGKTFLGKLLERLGYATYHRLSDVQQPLLSRLTLDDVASSRTKTREVRPLVDRYHIRQIILLSSSRVEERDMPAFELRVTEEDIAWVSARLFHDFDITIPEGIYPNYKVALASLP